MASILTPDEILLYNYTFKNWGSERLIKEVDYSLSISSKDNCDNIKQLKTTDKVELIASYADPAETTPLFTFTEGDTEITIDPTNDEIQILIKADTTKTYKEGRYYLKMYYTDDKIQSLLYEAMLTVSDKYR